MPTWVRIPHPPPSSRAAALRDGAERSRKRRSNPSSLHRGAAQTLRRSPSCAALFFSDSGESRGVATAGGRVEPHPLRHRPAPPFSGRLFLHSELQQKPFFHRQSAEKSMFFSSLRKKMRKNSLLMAQIMLQYERRQTKDGEELRSDGRSRRSNSPPSSIYR